MLLAFVSATCDVLSREKKLVNNTEGSNNIAEIY
jgi:hypothetical protein